MSILNIFNAPNFNVVSITVRYFDDFPDPRAEARESFMDYENVNVKPADTAGYVKEAVERIKAHNYRTFSFQEVSGVNRNAKVSKEGYRTLQNTIVLRFPDPIKGKPNRIKHIGMNVSYDALMLKPD